MLRLHTTTESPQVEDATDVAVAPPWMTVLHNWFARLKFQLLRRVRRANLTRSRPPTQPGRNHAAVGRAASDAGRNAILALHRGREPMTKDQILARIDRLLASCQYIPAPEPEQLLNGALTVMITVYGEGSQQLKTLVDRCHDMSKEPPIYRSDAVIAAVSGSLRNLREEIEAGFLSSIERSVTSDVLSDVIQLARAALSERGDGPKNVAAVLVAAAYEDTLRRIAKEHAGVIGQDKLESVIGKLKDAGLLVAPQLGIAQAHLNFRNRALHAQWDSIDRVGVETVLAFVEQLLLKYFS